MKSFIIKQACRENSKNIIRREFQPLASIVNVLEIVEPLFVISFIFTVFQIVLFFSFLFTQYMTLGSIFSKIGFPNCKFTNMLHQRAKAAISTLNLQEIILPNIRNFVWPGGMGGGDQNINACGKSRWMIIAMMMLG